MKTGHIIIGIDKKVYFEYYKLEKPSKERCIFGVIVGRLRKIMEEYEASKKLIEVENVFWSKLCKCWFYKCKKILYKIYANETINNQPCKAEIENNKATIIELTK